MEVALKMARSNCDYECDWPTCSGCPHNTWKKPDEVWGDYDEYDPADDEADDSPAEYDY